MTGLGSTPGIATLIRFLLTTIISGITYDTLKALMFAEKGDDCIVMLILIISLGGCGDMV